MYVAAFEFMRHTFVLSKKFTISWPLPSDVTQPHKLSWALKSPRRSTGGGSCEIVEIRSACVQALGGGKYIEQSVIGSGVEMRHAMACNVEFSGMTLWGTVFFGLGCPLRHVVYYCWW